MPYNFMPLAAFGRKSLNLRKHSLCAVILAASALLPASLAQVVEAAVPGNSFSLPDEQPGKMEPHTWTGSPFPGVIDCLLQRSSDTQPEVHINYPSFGHARVDEDIKDWVTGLADAFANNLDFTGLSCDLNGETGLLQTESAPYELWGEYSITRPSDTAVSIAFELWNYTGSGEANLDIITLNYSLLTGQRLNLVDIFEKPDVALQLMSDWSRKTLEPRLGAARRTAMLKEGTQPLIENFSSITLTPEGICINFQPWQVAPSAAGIQKVIMPLEELLPSAPLLALWGK